MKATWMDRVRLNGSTLAVPGLDYCTQLTKSIRFTANTVSGAMDTAGGGYVRHGGFHRLYGGHDISSLAAWKRFGLKYPKELGKDFLTQNGLPYPKLQYAVQKGWIKAGVAQKWGTWNIGKCAAASVAAFDTGFVVRGFAKDKARFLDRWVATSIKGAVKAGTGVSTGNVPLAIAGAVDLSLVAYAALDARIALDLEIGCHPFVPQF